MDENFCPMKKTLLPVIQILITLGLLCWIFRDPEQNRKMLDAIGKAGSDGGLWWFVPGIAALGIALLLQTQRWLVLLRVQDITVSFWRAFRIVLSGMFFNLFLLGSTGGDVIKIFFIMRETPDKKAGGAVGSAFLLSLPAHLLYFSIFYFAARAFSAGLGLLSIFCVMPVVSTVTALPISLGGAGWREVLFITLLGALYQTPKEIAMSISISGFLILVFWSLVGGLVYLLYRSSSPDGPTISEMEESVEEEEHIIEENAENGRGTPT